MLDRHLAPRLAHAPDPPGLRPGGRVAVQRRPAARDGGRDVEVLHVVLEHALGGDLRAQRRQGVLDHGQPLVGHAVGVRVRALRRLAVEPRGHVVLDELVEGGGLDVVALVRVRALVGGRDGPAVLAVVHLVPPAVEHREVQPAVEGGLHPGRAARLERAQRVVQPHVAAREEGPGHRDVVVGEEHDPVAHLRVVREAHEVLDQALALLVGRVGLPGDHELDGVLRVQQDPLEPLRVPQHEREPLVGGHPAGEADREHARVEDRVGPAQLGVRETALLPRRPQPGPDVLHQAGAQLPADGPQLGVVGAVDPAPPRGPVQVRAHRVEGQLRHARIDPGHDVHAVGDRADRHLVGVEARPQPLEHAPGDHAVQLGHPVGPLRQAQAHDRHVELGGVAAVVVLGAQGQDLGRGHGRGETRVEEVLDLRLLEPVDARGHRGVGREHGGRAHRGQGLVPRHRLGPVRRVHELRDPLDAQEPGVALVAVEDLRGGRPGQPGEGPQRPDPAHPEEQLLLEPVVAAAAVEAVRDVAGVVVVVRDVGVEQQQGDAADVGPPDVGGQGAAVGQGQGDPDRVPVLLPQQRQGHAVRVEHGVGLLLPRVAGQGLLEVAVLVEQADAHHRHAEVRGALEVVAGEDPQPARVLGEHGGDTVLGGEVGDGPRGVLRLRLLVPQVVGEVALEIGVQLLDPAHRGRVLGDLLDLLPGEGAEELDGVPVDRVPGLRVQLGEQLFGGPVPGPAEVPRESAQRGDGLRQHGAHGESTDCLHAVRLPVRRRRTAVPPPIRPPARRTARPGP